MLMHLVYFPHVATVLTVYGIETEYLDLINSAIFFGSVATVLTVYGIETTTLPNNNIKILAKLQQYLPFTVLKLS